MPSVCTHIRYVSIGPGALKRPDPIGVEGRGSEQSVGLNAVDALTVHLLSPGKPMPQRCRVQKW